MLSAMDRCTTDLCTVKEVAKYYVERNLGVTPGNNSNYRNPGYLLRKAYSLASTDLVPSDSIFTIIERLPSPLKEEMDNAVSTMLATLEYYYWMKHSQEINRHAAAPNPCTHTTQLHIHPMQGHLLRGGWYFQMSLLPGNLYLLCPYQTTIQFNLFLHYVFTWRYCRNLLPLIKSTHSLLTDKKNAKQLATYIFLLVTDVIKIASDAQNF
jgi:hypothetical protein